MTAHMAKKLDTKEIVNLKELVISAVVQSEALINIFDRKGIVPVGRGQEGRLKYGKVRDLRS